MGPSANEDPLGLALSFKRFNIGLARLVFTAPEEEEEGEEAEVEWSEGQQLGGVRVVSVGGRARVVIGCFGGRLVVLNGR